MANPLNLSGKVALKKVIRRKMNSLARRLSFPRAPAYPVYAWITPTTRCNLRCITCVRTIEPEWKSMDLEPEVYEIVRKEILPGLMFVELSGTGEPFLAPIFYTILEDVLRYNIEFSITTNLTVLPEDETLRKIIRSPGEIKVSIDGTDRETMTEVRQGLNYDLFWRNLQRISEMVKEINNPQFRLTFNFVITRRNVAQMPQLVEMAHKLGIRHIVFSSFLVGNRTDEFANESLWNKPEIVMPYLEEASARAEQYQLMITPPVFQHLPDTRESSTNSLPEQNKKSRSPLIGQCPHPWWSVYIDVDGTIMPCCVFGVPFGNLKKQSFKEIWNGAIYRHFRQIVNTPHMPEGCKKCTLNVRL